MKKKSHLLLPLTLVLTLVLSFAPLLCNNAYAGTIVSSGTFGESGDNLTWSLDSDGTLTIGGSGGMTTEVQSARPWEDDPESVYVRNVKKAIIQEGVTNIGYSVFAFYPNLTNVTIPESVKLIGIYAFYDCENLTGIHLPSGITTIPYGAFESCTKLSDINIPDGVTSIGYKAFYDCFALKSITIPQSVTEIDDTAFGRSSRVSDEDGLFEPAIYGYSGSYAQEYAKAKSLKFVALDAPAPAPAPVNPDPGTNNNSQNPVTPAPAAADGAANGAVVETSDGTVKVTSNDADTVAYVKANNVKSVTVPATVSLNGKTYKVTEIWANAFKGTKATAVTIGNNVKNIKTKAFNGSKVTTLNVKSKLLTKKTVKGSLKGSKVKTVKVKVGSKSQNKKFVKKYKSFFTKANAGKKATVK